MKELIKNRYKILSSIGIGGMAEVYLALDIQSGRTVAVKIMDKKLLVDPDYIKRFKREISITKHLNHPNIPKFIDYGEMEDTKAPYLVMEYIQGISLTQYIKRKGKVLYETLTGKNFPMQEQIMAYSNTSALHLKYCLVRCLMRYEYNMYKMLIVLKEMKL